jgi:hypothetical protein
MHSACALAAQVIAACLLLVLVVASQAEASQQQHASRKLAQSKGRQWESKQCISWGDPKLKTGEKDKEGNMLETHPHDYCDKHGGVRVCCWEDKCGSITCARGNRVACCPEK